MGEFCAHRIRFFEYQPKAVHCLAYEPIQQKLALSRSDGSVEIVSVADNWYQEKVIKLADKMSVESLLWCGHRLFSAGLHGDLIEYDLQHLTAKLSVSSNSGAIWCLAANQSKTQIAAATESGSIVIFKLSEASADYYRSLDRQEGRIMAVAWYEGAACGSTGPLIISSGVDTIRVWSVRSGHALRRMTVARSRSHIETIVWALVVTSDLVIVTGDSRGFTSFWNGKQGILIKEYKSHKADVLTLALNDSHTSIFASGVDPTIMQFDLVPRGGATSAPAWVQGHSRSNHTHDVRAAVVVGDRIVTAGVDCQLIVNATVYEERWTAMMRLPALPHKSCVYTAKKASAVLLQYSTFVELWKLGSTDETAGPDGDMLPLKTKPMKLLKLKCRPGESIVCAAVSPDAHWLAYSDLSALRIFQLTQTYTVGRKKPTVEVQKVRTGGALTSAHSLAFTPVGQLIVLTDSASLLLIDSHKAPPIEVRTIEPATDVSAGAHLLVLSACGQLAAVGDHSNNVNIYNLQTTTHVCTLPRYDCQPTAITFDSSSTLVAVAYADRRMVEFSLVEQAYTDWGRSLIQLDHTLWLGRRHPFTHLAYHPRRPHLLIVADAFMFCIINKTQPLPTKADKIFNRPLLQTSQESHALHVCAQVRFLLHMDILDDDFLLLVERPREDILKKLPPVLAMKKFGT